MTSGISDGQEIDSWSADELRALLSVSDAMASGIALEEILHLIVLHAGRLCGAEHSALGVVAQDHIRFDVEIGISNNRGGKSPLTRGITGWVARHNRSQYLPDAQEDPRFFNHLEPIGINSELVVPVSFHDRVLGVLDVESTRRNAFNEHHEKLLIELSKRAGLAISSASLRNGKNALLEAEIAHLRVLQDLDLRLSERLLNLDSILQAILDSAVAAVNADAGQFLLVDDSHLVVRSYQGGFLSNSPKRLPIDGSGVTVRCFKTRKPILIRDTRSAEWQGTYLEIAEGMNSEIALPILRDGRCLGVLNLESRQVGAFKQAHLDLAGRMASRASLTIDFSKRVDIVHKIALTSVQAKSVSLAEVLDSIYRGVEELFSPDVKSAVFLISTEDSRKLDYAPGHSEDLAVRWGNIRPILIGTGVVGRTVETRKKVHIRSVSQEAPNPDQYIAHIDDTETSVGFPLTTPEGRVLGAFIVETAEPDAFSDLDIEILELCAQFAAIALSNYAYIEALDEAKQYAVSRAGLTALGEITGNLVHRISNDIGAAHEEIKYVLSDLSASRDVKSKLSIARRNCGEVLRLVKNLLERIGDLREENHRDLHLDVEVGKAIAAIRNIPKSVKLTLNIPQEMGAVRSTHALALVIEELIRNALKSFGKETSGEISITAIPKDRHVLLSVWNNGKPIPTESHKQIFNFLYQGENANRRSGIGFGLYWARAVLRGQGGGIVLSFSDLSLGTQFDITLLRSEAARIYDTSSRA